MADEVDVDGTGTGSQEERSSSESGGAAAEGGAHGHEAGAAAAGAPRGVATPPPRKEGAESAGDEVAELSERFNKQHVVYLIGRRQGPGAILGCSNNLKRKLADLRALGTLGLVRGKGDKLVVRAVASGFPNATMSDAFRLVVEARCRTGGVARRVKVMRALAEEFTSGGVAGPEGKIRVESDGRD